MFDANAKAAFLKYAQHRNVVGKDFCRERSKSGLAPNAGEMAHQCRAEPLALVEIDYRKCDLRLTGLLNHIARATHDNGLPILLRLGNEGHMVDKVDIQEIDDFLFGEMAF
jgi:hypothetical protein